MTNPTTSAGADRSPPGPTPPPVDEPTPASVPPVRRRTLTLLFMAESLALALLQLPQNLSFDGFAILDQGANLKAQQLLDQGLVPTVDFGYVYGLLPLLVGRAWFALLGRTPQAYAAAMLVVDLLIAWGLARCAYALRAGPAAIALILCTMSAATLGSYINLAHACEAVLICHALAEHAAGRRPRALALLTACLFMKPVMAYLYGFLLVLLIARAGGIRGLVRAAIPAAATGTLLLAAMTAWFGPGPVIHSLLPLQGAESYRLANYGFFRGRGQRFWLPDGVTPRHYAFTHAGHYLLGSVVLVAAAAAAIWRLVRRPAARDDLGAEVVACCGIMHLAFVTSFYGDFMSYTYYYYILIIGLVAVSARGRRRALLIALLAAAALIGNKDWGGYIKHQWRDTAPGADTFGLWADADCHEEWRRVRQIIGDRNVPFLTDNGGFIEMCMPGFRDLEELFLCDGYPTPEELRRKLRQVAGSDFVLMTPYDKSPRLPDRWPELREALRGFELVWSGERFLVYRRRPSNHNHSI